MKRSVYPPLILLLALLLSSAAFASPKLSPTTALWTSLPAKQAAHSPSRSTTPRRASLLRRSQQRLADLVAADV